jgi:RNase P/RNase MRP subunit p30
MRHIYSAVDMRGIKNDHFDIVVSTEPDTGDYLALELTHDTFQNRRSLIKGAAPHIVYAQGKDLAFNRQVLESAEVDVLSRPYPVDDTLARLAARNDKAFEICASHIRSTRGYMRARLFQSLMKTIDLALRRDVDIIITSGASRDTDIFTPRELVAFGVVLGMDYPQAKASVTMIPSAILGVDPR